MIKRIFGILIKALLILLGIILCILIGIGVFSYVEYQAWYRDVSMDEKLEFKRKMENQVMILSDTWSLRRTGNTLMSIPEWYIVSISDDYTTWLESWKNPSDFPYWQYLSDYWTLYGKITALMDGTIPRDYEYHTMVRVIWLSTTLEFWLKSFYEMSTWRVSSFISYESAMDKFYSESSRRYVDFILLRPWYEFDYARELTLFAPIKTPHFLRNLERWIVYKIEYSLKDSYAHIIEEAAHSNFAIPDVYTTVEWDFSRVESSSLSWVIVSDTWSIKIPRYHPFTEILPKILRWSTQITKIAWNQFIVSEFRTKNPDTIASSLIRIQVPIQEWDYRVFSLDAVSELTEAYWSLQNNLVHIYDF